MSSGLFNTFIALLTCVLMFLRLLVYNYKSYYYEVIVFLLSIIILLKNGFQIILFSLAWLIVVKFLLYTKSKNYVEAYAHMYYIFPFILFYFAISHTFYSLFFLPITSIAMFNLIELYDLYVCGLVKLTSIYSYSFSNESILPKEIYEDAKQLLESSYQKLPLAAKKILPVVCIAGVCYYGFLSYTDARVLRYLLLYNHTQSKIYDKNLERSLIAQEKISLSNSLDTKNKIIFDIEKEKNKTPKMQEVLEDLVNEKILINERIKDLHFQYKSLDEEILEIKSKINIYSQGVYHPIQTDLKYPFGIRNQLNKIKSSFDEEPVLSAEDIFDMLNNF